MSDSDPEDELTSGENEEESSLSGAQPMGGVFFGGDDLPIAPMRRESTPAPQSQSGGLEDEEGAEEAYESYEEEAAEAEDEDEAALVEEEEVEEAPVGFGPKIKDGSKGTVLLAWELGSGLGHVSDLLDVGRQLRDKGWRLAFAGRELHSRFDEVAALFDIIVPSPWIVQLERIQGFRARTFCDVLKLYGFTQPDRLRPYLAAWDGLFDILRPDVIVSHFCPVMNLAALGKVPVVTMGGAFYSPPRGLKKFPKISDADSLGVTEEDILKVVAGLQEESGAKVPHTVGRLLAGDDQVVGTIPEFDLYRKQRKKPATGPMRTFDKRIPMPDDRRLFVYLNWGFGGSPKLVDALAQSGVEAVVFIKGLPEDARKKLEDAGVEVHTKPLPMDEVFARCSGVVHHGGSGTTLQAATVGRSQLIIPQHLEQGITGKLAADLGIAVSGFPNLEAEKWAGIFKKFVHDEKVLKQAKRFSATLRKRPPASSVRRVVQAVEKRMPS